MSRTHEHPPKGRTHERHPEDDPRDPLRRPDRRRPSPRRLPGRSDPRRAHRPAAAPPRCDRGRSRVEGELIDCMIRILDALVEMKIDPEEVLRLKMDYNNTRPYRHGGKLA